MQVEGRRLLISPSGLCPLEQCPLELRLIQLTWPIIINITWFTPQMYLLVLMIPISPVNWGEDTICVQLMLLSLLYRRYQHSDKIYSGLSEIPATLKLNVWICDSC